MLFTTLTSTIINLGQLSMKMILFSYISKYLRKLTGPVRKVIKYICNTIINKLFYLKIMGFVSYSKYKTSHVMLSF